MKGSDILLSLKEYYHYRNFLIEEIWRLTDEINLKQKIEHSDVTDILLEELEQKLYLYVQLRKSDNPKGGDNKWTKSY